MTESPVITENIGTLNPTAMSVIYSRPKKRRTAMQLYMSQVNLKSNAHKDRVSPASLKKIRSSVNWLVFLAHDKKVIDPLTKFEHPYRCGLATISLPTGCETITPAFFRTVLLESLIAAMKHTFQLENYIWKIERQKRGALHAHITLDQFIPHEWLRSTWCKLLRKHGLTQTYHDRFSNLTLREYIQYRRATDKPHNQKKYRSLLQYTKSLIKAFQAGEKSNWHSPNCTDIHAVKSVKSLASYLSKYIGKDPELGDDFRGRYWACSYSLNRVRNQRFHVPEKWYNYFVKCAERVCEKIEDILVMMNDNRDVRFLGGLFYFQRRPEFIRTHPLFRSLFDSIQLIYHSLDPPLYPIFIFDPTTPSIFNPINSLNYAN